ncbi:MAG: hypothetical protein PVF33_09760 [Candidatus Latescibacterota bacterium]
MKRTTLCVLLALSATALWMIAGCSSTEEPGIDDELVTREQVVNLDDPYGGFNFGDEEPAFGDEQMSALYGPELNASYDDPTEDDPDVVRARDRLRPVTYLMITWGNLEADSTITSPTDWSGSLSAENGAICLKRTIFFDAHDQILPRTSRDLLEWVSHTQPHFDGILVALHKIVKPDTTVDSASVDVNDVAMSVTFDTGPLTVTINETDLADLHRVVTVDDAGNAVAFNTFKFYPQGCPQGFMAGQWRPVADRPGGIFRGKWISANGVHEGYLRGIYGPSSDGDKVFFGKWIRRDGRFEGLLVGYYGNYDAHPGGWFRGAWLTRSLHVGGHVNGVWNTRDTADRPGGFFKGRWKMACPNAVTPD